MWQVFSLLVAFRLFIFLVILFSPTTLKHRFHLYSFNGDPWDFYQVYWTLTCLINLLYSFHMEQEFRICHPFWLTVMVSCILRLILPSQVRPDFPCFTSQRLFRFTQIFPYTLLMIFFFFHFESSFSSYSLWPEICLLGSLTGSVFEASIYIFYLSKNKLINFFSCGLHSCEDSPAPRLWTCYSTRFWNW